MKRYIFTLLASLAFCCASAQDKRPDTLWYQYDNRFVGNEVISIVGFDSITFNKTGYKSRTIATEDFVSVEATCFADITYHQIPLDSTVRVVLQAPENILDDCSGSVVDGTLRLSLNHSDTHPKEAVAVVHIYAPAVCDFSLVGGKCLRLGKVRMACPMSIVLDGVGSIVADSIAAPELKAVLNGAGHIDLRGIDADAVSATLNGAGIIALEGKARRASAALNGAGTIDLQGLRTDIAPECSVSGAGQILQNAK